ncbi:MAG TPA: hypothetical protein VHX66_03980 [Solirubrobacteraceae bacterium]|nr:hypothetical protein [Solirubrobacteraceae bacterium]
MSKPDPTARLRAMLGPLIGVEHPQSFENCFLAMLAPFQDASRACDEGRRRNDLVVNVWEGMLAVRYHRNAVERIELETIRRVLDEFTPPWEGPETSISIKMSTLGFEYVAYLNAARRTLDYLARGVAACFSRQGGSIKALAKTLTDAEPRGLAEEVRTACAGVVERFPHLLSARDGKSPRDRAAHRSPVEAASLLVVLGPNGIGMALQDGEIGHLAPASQIAISGATPGQPQLTSVLDAQIRELEDFVLEVLAYAATTPPPS